MKKKQVLIITLAIMFHAALAAAAPIQRIHQIQSPLLSIPAIVKAGDSFAIKLNLAPDQKLVSARLQSLTDPAKQIELKLAGQSFVDGLAVRTANVPADTPEDTYDLIVALNDATSDTQPHAVKVIKQFKEDFDFIQLTDIHFNVQFMPDKDMNLIRRRIMQDITALKPEFVIFTGDLGLDPETYDTDYKYGYEEITKYMQAPMFMIPGNHEQYYLKDDAQEIDGDQYWTAAYGPTHHSFDYGKMHFVGINDFEFTQRWRERRSKEAAFAGTLINSHLSTEQWAWLQGDLKSSHERGQYCVAYAHIPVENMMGGKTIGSPPKREKLDGPTDKQFINLLDSDGCAYIFIGHMHMNVERKFGALTEILTRDAGISKSKTRPKWGYRVIHVKGGQIIGSEIIEIGFEDLEKK
jgi:hypothetical protein